MEGYQSSVFDALKQWFDGQRSQGQFCSSAWLRDRYISLLEQAVVKRKVQLTEISRALKELSDSGHISWDDMRSMRQSVDRLTSERTQLVARIERMQSASEVSRGTYWRRIMTAVGASRRSQQRVTQLTAQEIQLRVNLTWQGFDRAQWVAVKGSDEDLIMHCASPSVWRSRLQSTVWLFWDHAPVWLKPTGAEQCLISAREIEQSKRRRLQSKAVQRGLHASLAAAVSDTPEQTVAPGSGSDQKFRLTLIMFQSVEQWFNPSEAPVGHACLRSQRDPNAVPLSAILIVKSSSHCRWFAIFSGVWTGLLTDHSISFLLRRPVNVTAARDSQPIDIESLPVQDIECLAEKAVDGLVAFLDWFY